MKRERQLEDYETQLLERYYDGECSWLDRGRVRNLVKRNALAADYLESLGRGSELLSLAEGDRESLFQDATSNDELWGRISQRIEAEERASIFLGDRVGVAARSGSEKIGVIQRFVEWSRPVFAEKVGYGGMAVAACSVLIVTGLGPTMKNYLSNPTSGSNSDTIVADAGMANSGGSLQSSQPIKIVASPVSGQMAPVPVELVSTSMGNSRDYYGKSFGEDFPLEGIPLTESSFNTQFARNQMMDAPQFESRGVGSQNVRRVASPTFVSRNSGNSVEVDWMRSDGRVRILNSPQANAPIIFVKPRSPLARVRRNQRSGATSETSNGIVLNEAPVPAATFASR